MQTPSTLPPAPNSDSFRNHNAALPFRSPGSANESFDAMMSHAMSAASPERDAREFADRRAAAAKPDAEKRNPISSHKSQRPPPPQGKAGKDMDGVQSENNTNTDGISVPKSNSDDSDKTQDSPVIIESNRLRDDSQNGALQIIAPAAAISPPVLIPVVGGKNLPITAAGISPTEGGAEGVEISTNPTTTQTISEIEEFKKIKESNKPSAAKKINPAESKAAETTTAFALNLKPAGDGDDEVTPQNISGGTAENLPSPEISVASASTDKPGMTAAFQTYGTLAAKLDVSMNKENNTNNIAGSAEQVLPGKEGAIATEKNAPKQGTFVMPFSSIATASDAAANSLTSGQTVSATSSLDGPLVCSNVIDLPARAMERTHDMVALQALRLVEVKSDSLQIVIKPGAGIQLSLELRQRADGIEAQAILQQGDFSQMNEHWAELQQRLEQRGIRLAPLTGDENAAAFGGNNQFQKQQQRPSNEQDSLAAGAFAEFAMITPPASAAPQRGWQTWA
jgi:hypothetical protein